MNIHEASVQRIEAGMTYDPDTIMLIFEELMEQAKINKPSTVHFSAVFISEEDEFVPGDYVPEIWFVLRKVMTDDELQAEDQAGQ